MMPTTSRIPVPLILAHLDLASTTVSNSNGSQPTNSSPSSTILTPNTLPPSTRRAFLNHLQSTSSIPQLNDLLTTTLQKCSTTQPHGAADWPSRVHALALELLRSGACGPNFQDLMTEITRRALQPRGRSQQQREGGTPERQAGERVGTIVLPRGSYDEDGLPDIRMPREVLDNGLAFLEDQVRGGIEIVGTEDEEESERWGREKR